MENYVFLRNVKFFAYHGVGKQEYTVGNNFMVNLRLGVDFTKAMDDDDLSGTVNYAEVYALLKSEMSKPSKLLEHVAGRIKQHLLVDYPQLLSIDLEIEKLTPPISADLYSCGVEIHWKK